MPVLARFFEETGLSTIFVTNMPFWAEMVGVPRTLAIEYPFGHILGQPSNSNQQLDVILEALMVLETAKQPGSIFHSEKRWDEGDRIAKEKWQPDVPSPVINLVSGKIRDIIRNSRERITKT